MLGSFFDQRLVNKVTAVIAPMIIGGDAQTAVRGRGAERMRDALRLNHMTVERMGADLLVSGYPSNPERELEVKVRPAGQSDADTIDELLAVQAIESSPNGEELLVSALGGDSVVWLAAIEDDVLGVAAVRVEAERRAAIQCLAARPDAPSSTIARLRDACEASAAGREAEWVTLAESAAPGMSEDDFREAGYRYYRRDEAGSDVLIKRVPE